MRAPLLVVHPNIGYAAVEYGFEDADARRQPRGNCFVAEGQDAGKENQAGRLIGIQKFEIFDGALSVVLGVADQHAIAVRPRLVFEADQDA